MVKASSPTWEVVKNTVIFVVEMAIARVASVAHIPVAGPSCVESVAHNNPVATPCKTPLLFWCVKGVLSEANQTACRILGSRSQESLSADDGDLSENGEVDLTNRFSLNTQGTHWFRFRMLS
jgi:hypothetical protein